MLLISQVSGYVCICLMAFTYKLYKTQQYIPEDLYKQPKTRYKLPIQLSDPFLCYFHQIDYST